MTTYYGINQYKEVGFFRSDLDMRNGGTVFVNLGEEFTIVGYNIDGIEIGGAFVANLGIINDGQALFSAQKWAEDGWAVVKPIEVLSSEELRKLLARFQYRPLMEYIGGELEEDDAEDLSMIPSVDEDDMPF